MLRKANCIAMFFIILFVTFVDPCEGAEQWLGETIAPTMPGYEVEKHIGICWVTSSYSGHGTISDNIKSSFNDLGASCKGANAVVNVRISQGSYEQQGSRWGASSIIVYGDCVKLRKSGLF